MLSCELDPNKSPGPGGIPSIVIKHCSVKIVIGGFSTTAV